MAVEIQILSGSQQGRCLRFDGDRILVGDVAVADVQFDPDRESRARGKNAIITLDDEEGWRISNVGAGVWLVNQTPVESSQTHRLRSEDLVRVSEAGPDFCFRLVAGPHGCAIPAIATPAYVADKPASKQAENATPATISQLIPTAGVVPGGRGEPEAGLALATPSQSQATFPPGAPCEAGSPPNGRREEKAMPVAIATEKSPVREPDRAEEIAPFPPPKTRRKRRETSSLRRLVGVVVSGLLGLACAYGLGCWIGGEKNNVFHVFYKAKVQDSPSSPAVTNGEPVATTPAASKGP